MLTVYGSDGTQQISPNSSRYAALNAKRPEFASAKLEPQDRAVRVWQTLGELLVFERSRSGPEAPSPRYGIMMKRQEFREKAEEIGFIKYR